jgi:hypothetical protein
VRRADDERRRGEAQGGSAGAWRAIRGEWLSRVVGLAGAETVSRGRYCFIPAPYLTVGP